MLYLYDLGSYWIHSLNVIDDLLIVMSLPNSFQIHQIIAVQTCKVDVYTQFHYVSRHIRSSNRSEITFIFPTVCWRVQRSSVTYGINFTSNVIYVVILYNETNTVYWWFLHSSSRGFKATKICKATPPFKKTATTTTTTTTTTTNNNIKQQKTTIPQTGNKAWLYLRANRLVFAVGFFLYRTSLVFVKSSVRGQEGNVTKHFEKLRTMK